MRDAEAAVWIQDRASLEGHIRSIDGNILPWIFITTLCISSHCTVSSETGRFHSYLLRSCWDLRPGPRRLHSYCCSRCFPEGLSRRLSQRPCLVEVDDRSSLWSLKIQSWLVFALFPCSVMKMTTGRLRRPRERKRALPDWLPLPIILCLLITATWTSTGMCASSKVEVS